jgi:hypothetical protein
VRIGATPVSDADGPRLADEVLAAIAAVTREEEDDAAEPPRSEPNGRRREPVTQEYES